MSAHRPEVDLYRLPLPDDAVDTVVCALALEHIPELAPVLAEFARVLRPGGHLRISDAHLVSYLRPTLARRPGLTPGPLTGGPRGRRLALTGM
ncbi:class I SAM-dependent methyltransferase [Streptomyces xylophagus]|uniref:class I SAM-dependent methyltransferase n=1 Tax=Streptomyces xylophagus TaxID=285514 RepID=UPI000A6B8070|nr:class I SAM-dependent methyltransferase [Streptomyces xylophagus]